MALDLAGIVNPDRRTEICRERNCGRGIGQGAPHTDECSVGKARRAHDGFSYAAHVQELARSTPEGPALSSSPVWFSEAPGATASISRAPAVEHTDGPGAHSQPSHEAGW